MTKDTVANTNDNYAPIKEQFQKALQRKYDRDNDARVYRTSGTADLSMLRPDGSLRSARDSVSQLKTPTIMAMSAILTAKTEAAIFEAQTLSSYSFPLREAKRIVNAFFDRLADEAK
jgi:hypothetical protein